MKRGAIQTGMTRSRVMSLVRDHEEISRIELARELGMDRSTMTHVIKDLLKEGLLREKEAGQSERSGRKPILLSINGDYGSVLGIELQPDFMRFALTDLSGKVRYEEEQQREDDDPLKGIEDFISKSNLSAYPPLMGVGAALPGTVDPHRGLLVESLTLDRFNYSMEQAAGFPLLIDNDANCFARAVLNRESLRNGANILCLIGEGHRHGKPGLSARDDIGIGIIINGTVYYGSHYTAGEPGGAPFFDKSLAFLEESEKEAYLTALFSYLENTLYLLDTEALHIGGELGSFEDYAHVLTPFVPPRCTVRFNRTDPYEIARGGAFLFLDQLFTPSPSGEREDCLSRIGWKEF